MSSQPGVICSKLQGVPALLYHCRALEHWEPLAGEPALNIEAVALVREALQEVPTCVTSLTLSGICFGNHIM
jgi:hypothetical protein